MTDLPTEERRARAAFLRRYIAETERLARLLPHANAEGRASILAKRDAYASQLAECSSA